MVYYQITQLESTLHSLRHTLHQRKEELIRLERALGQLIQCQAEFRSYEHVCVSPEFSAKTWHGRRANQFKSFQENDLLPNYQSVSEEQLTRIIDQVQSKIQEIKGMITNLQTSISNTESRLASLREQRRRELLNQ